MNKEIAKNNSEMLGVEKNGSDLTEHHFLYGYTARIDGKLYPVVAVFPETNDIRDSNATEKIKKLITEVA